MINDNALWFWLGLDAGRGQRKRKPIPKHLLGWAGVGALGGWLLHRQLQTEHAPDLGVVTRPSEKHGALGIMFGKPLPRAMVSGGWGDPRPKHVGSYHYAIDLPAATGTPIFAATSGTVVRADSRGNSTAGKHVVVKHDDGVHTRYLHMSVVYVREQQRVGLGEVIGLVGSTGFSSAPHLHLDVFLPDDMLPMFRAKYGTPTPIFPSKRRWGTQVPAESLIPVDGYSRRVAGAAFKRDVRLLQPEKAPPHGLGLSRRFDGTFLAYEGEIPVAYLRALAKRESNMHPKEHSGPAWGLLQIVEVVRQDYNKRHGVTVTREELLHPNVNVRLAVELLRMIIASFKRNHPQATNLRVDWSNPRFVELLTFGWNSGFSEAAGLGKIASFLERMGTRDFTIEDIHGNARRAGAVRFLSSTTRMRWSKSVARLYMSERKRDRKRRVS